MPRWRSSGWHRQSVSASIRRCERTTKHSICGCLPTFSDFHKRGNLIPMTPPMREMASQSFHFGDVTLGQKLPRITLEERIRQRHFEVLPESLRVLVFACCHMPISGGNVCPVPLPALDPHGGLGFQNSLTTSQFQLSSHHKAARHADTYPGIAIMRMS